MKPHIGTVCDLGTSKTNIYSISKFNLSAIQKSGGMPLIIPISGDFDHIAHFVNSVDGILIPGGIDVSPLTYGEEPIESVSFVRREKDAFEIALIKEASRQNKPILGICRGMQIINVAMGGTLFQDIKTQASTKICHIQANEVRDELTHSIDIVNGTFMHEIFKTDQIAVNSFHHQAIKDIAPNFNVAATSKDGIIEAFEDSSGLIFAVQFHPETLFERHNEFLALFELLIEQAKIKR